MTLLTRNRNGGVHLATCRYGNTKTSVPWNWAEGRNPAEWRDIPWLKPCLHCLPLSAAEAKWGDPIMVDDEVFALIEELGS